MVNTMKKISLLDQNTIDKIAAGEVIERPASIVKELVENAVDAGSSAVTVEVKEGGISFIRITDNGSGIPRDQVALAFLRHATSKIQALDDLQTISSLGFRGEALSSIAAVSQVELITKTHTGFTGIRYLIEGGKEKSLEEIGAPDGTTFIIRNLFYNTPARKKFLKSPVTEANYVSSFMEQLALSHPDISFKYMLNGQTKLHTSGNGNFKEVIYQIYGREVTKDLIEIDFQNDLLNIIGYIGKPTISRGNRGFENYYVNGRYIKSRIVMKAIEDGYRSFMMQHKYPFTALNIQLNGEAVDINVHPTKMEVRFEDQDSIYRAIYRLIHESLSQKNLIPEVSFEPKKKELVSRPEKQPSIPEPFEVSRRADYQSPPPRPEIPAPSTAVVREKTEYPAPDKPEAPAVQQTLFEEKGLLWPETKKFHHIIGQLFDTYWLVQMEDKLYIIDQHAAHEKVLYERLLKNLKNKQITSQYLSPAMIISLTLQQVSLLEEYLPVFKEFGFEIESFGGKEYQISAVPDNLYGLTRESLFIELLDSLDSDSNGQPLDIIMEKLAQVACKAAVKGNNSQSEAEVRHLIDELLGLENPYHCPHGRPTIVSMSKYEIEKKFKRIV